MAVPFVTYNVACSAAVEAQTFSLKLPGSFFNMYSPPRSDSAVRMARDRLEEELRFVSKMVG